MLTTDNLKELTSAELDRAIVTVRAEEKDRRQFLRQLLTERGRRVAMTKVVGPNRVLRDQCDDAFAFVEANPDCSTQEVGDALYPWEDPRFPTVTRRAFADRRLMTLLETGEVRRTRVDGRYCWQAADPAS